MKRLLVTIAMLGAVATAMAQVVMQETTHGVLPGYPNPMIRTTAVAPGPAGEGVAWDFSALPQLGPFRGEVVEPSTMAPAIEYANANSCLVEDDLQCFLRSSKEGLDVMGERMDEGKVEWVYYAPLRKHAYPFAYGDHFTSTTTGQQRYQGSNFVFDFSVSVSSVADGQGTLILPGTTLHNALRVKTVRQTNYSHEGQNAGGYTVETYRWYVASHRYPVLTLNFTRKPDGTLEPAKSAYNPVVEPVAEQLPIAEGSEVKPKDATLKSLTVTPNPFGSELHVSYELAKAGNVILALYDVQGFLVATLAQGAKDAGEYTATFTSQLQQLPAGVYVLRLESAGSCKSAQLLKQ